jgi:hypothetical protein
MLSPSMHYQIFQASFRAIMIERGWFGVTACCTHVVGLIGGCIQYKVIGAILQSSRSKNPMSLGTGCKLLDKRFKNKIKLLRGCHNLH